ncbi:MAG: BON domain-containing protein [Planctomycetaceae bacterium]|nr:BON domain-containing protein [Planctomycetaceae bacterium]
MMLTTTVPNTHAEHRRFKPEDSSRISADQQLQALAVAALAEARHTTGRHVRASVNDGVVELTGRVPSYYAKQLAQSRVLQIAGVVALENSLQVASAGD